VCLRSKKLGLEAGLIGLVWDQTGRFGLEAGLIVLVSEQTSRFGLEVGLIGLVWKRTDRFGLANDPAVCGRLHSTSKWITDMERGVR